MIKKYRIAVNDASRAPDARYHERMAEQASTGRRVAFFGGSFDPPHLGHLAVARAAQAALGLDTVLFAPVGAQPLKPLGSTASYEDRLALTKLAIAGDASFAVSLADAPKATGAPNYTLDALEALKAELPPRSALFCLMGADSFEHTKRLPLPECQRCMWHTSCGTSAAKTSSVECRTDRNLTRLQLANVTSCKRSTRGNRPN